MRLLGGLDVAVFSVLKLYWSQEQDRHERETGETITKENFLVIYGRAHLCALQPEIIGAAFRKTGVWPYNPNVITEAMMAPSHVIQWKRDTLPLPPPTPVCIVSNLIHNLTLKNDGQPTFLTTISKSSDQEPDTSSDTTST
ncbi:uncharacterized protein ARMOST_16219 [Armillaria ostoyae]|uniref:Uncharacterized protein n=1 Tax=Armillaria ostoyae TaxID=47428 RepID=A0A284RVJ9_ARMOS|nr:uncharacterized protein ARMOST_16219 [Armillaria ostoyae]